MQADEYIARRIQLEDFAIRKEALDQGHALAEVRHLVAERYQQVATAACLRIVDLVHQVSAIIGRESALKCLDCGKRVFSGGITRRFQDADKDHLVNGKAELRAVGVDRGKI